MRFQILPVALLLLLPLHPIAAQTAPVPVPLPTSKPTAKKPLPFLQIRDQQLLLGPLPFRNVGATIPDLLTRFLRGDDAGATAALTDARAAGMRFVRCAGLPPAADVARIFAADQPRWFAAWDRMLTAAADHEIALVPSLLYDPQTLPRISADTAGATGPTDLLDANTPANKLAVLYITAVVTRYRNDPRILFWEIGNEINLLADLASADAATVPSVSDRVRAFLAQMATLIHRLDKRHLVTSGNGDLPSYAAHLPHRWPRNRYPAVASVSTAKDSFEQYQQMLDFFNPPGIDIISVHEHPPLADKVHWLDEDDVTPVRLSWTQLACTNLGKPLFVGAFGQRTPANSSPQSVPWMLDFLRRMQAEGSPLAALQSWEPGADDPTADTDAVSPSRTPQLAFAVRVVNIVIANARANNLVLPIGPPLDLSPEAMQADRQRTLLQLLHAILMGSGEW